MKLSDPERTELLALRRKVKRLERAIRWALGEEGDFGANIPRKVDGSVAPFWWRTELRGRAFKLWRPLAEYVAEKRSAPNGRGSENG